MLMQLCPSSTEVQHVVYIFSFRVGMSERMFIKEEKEEDQGWGGGEALSSASYSISSPSLSVSVPPTQRVLPSTPSLRSVTGLGWVRPYYWNIRDALKRPITRKRQYDCVADCSVGNRRSPRLWWTRRRSSWRLWSSSEPVSLPQLGPTFVSSSSDSR